MLQFNEKTPTILCEIMGRNKSDKGNIDITNSWHNYTTLYNSIFENLRNNNLRIFELGLGTNNINLPSNMGVNGRPGASLYGWSEYFPNSLIFGADIDMNILFNTDKIKTYFCDMLNPSIIKDMWNNKDLHENFDIIIEDGLHEFNANVCFFENSIHKLKKGGYYIIEDIHHNDFISFENKIKEWKNIYPYLNFNLIKIPSTRNIYDNNLLVIF
jgi:SAM-dependent methyltransferase